MLTCSRNVILICIQGFNLEVGQQAAPPAPTPPPPQETSLPEASVEPSVVPKSPGRLRVNRKTELTISAQPHAHLRPLHPGQTREEDAIAAAAAFAASTTPLEPPTHATTVPMHQNQVDHAHDHGFPQAPVGDHDVAAKDNCERSDTIVVANVLADDEYYGASGDVGDSLLLKVEPRQEPGTITEADQALLAQHQIDPLTEAMLTADGTRNGHTGDEQGGTSHPANPKGQLVGETGLTDVVLVSAGFFGSLDDVASFSFQMEEHPTATQVSSSPSFEDQEADSGPQKALESSMQRSGSFCNEGSDVVDYTQPEGAAGTDCSTTPGDETSGSSTPRANEASEERETPQMLRMTIKKSVTFCAAAATTQNNHVRLLSQHGQQTMPAPDATTACPEHMIHATAITPGQSIHPLPTSVPSSSAVSSGHHTVTPIPLPGNRSYPLSPSVANSTTRSPPHISPTDTSSGTQLYSGRSDQQTLPLAGIAGRVRLPELPSVVNSRPVLAPPPPMPTLPAAPRPTSALATAFVGGSAVAGARGPAQLQQSHGMVAQAGFRSAQSARRAAVPRTALADRARLIHDDLHHGVTSEAHHMSLLSVYYIVTLGKTPP